LDSAGNLFIADQNNHRIREVGGGVISTIAGDGTCGFSGDAGPATHAMLCFPSDVAVDAKNNVYIGDSANRRVREVTAADGNVNTIGGTGTPGFNGNGLPATLTDLDVPNGVAVNSTGVFVADSGQARVRKIEIRGQSVTVP
jgi:sugar lactone lactonase YvrE